jgi:hypothetical protein
MRASTLRISSTLALPLDAVTQKLAYLGRTGSGKTFGCKRMVEQMLHAKAQVVVLDGSGGWAGLRLGPKAFKIPVFGGLHGDIPLEPAAGELVADLIVDRGISVVLDVSQMLDAERTRFATAFARRFFQRKKAAPGAVHLVLEECQDFVPENCQRGEEQMLHEFQRLAKQGRPHGIGISFISQRPQEISKKALNQAECVFAFQMNGPHERKALQYWLSDKGFEGKLADVLPTLEIGAPYVWSPQWLKISKIVRILPIETLDTSATPKVGGKAFKQKKLTPIDLKGLTTAMADVVERAKAEDPKLLRAENARLKAELEKALRRAPEPSGPTKIVQVPTTDAETVAAIVAIAPALDQARTALGNLSGAISGANALVKTAEARARKALPRNSGQLAKAQPPLVTARVEHEAAKNLVTKTNGSAAKPYSGASTVSGGLRRMMIALAQRPGLTNRQLGVRAGLSSRSGTFSTYLSRGRSEGWIADQGEKRSLTEQGLAALGTYEPLPEGRELLRYWLHELGGGASRMLAALAEAYPRNLTNEQLGEAAGISHRSGTFSTYLSRMRTLELVEGRGELRLPEELVG